MTERPIGEQDLSPEWTQTMEEGIRGAIENYYGVPVEFNPISLAESDDPQYQKSYDDLSIAERRFIRAIVYDALNFNPDVAELVDSQVASAPHADKKGVRNEAVFKTDRSDEEDLYVHIITFEESGEMDGLFIAPRDLIL